MFEYFTITDLLCSITGINSIKCRMNRDYIRSGTSRFEGHYIRNIDARNDVLIKYGDIGISFTLSVFMLSYLYFKYFNRRFINIKKIDEK